MSRDRHLTPEAELNKLSEQNLQLLYNGRYSDCTVKCGSIEFAAHKSVICERNDYFRAALDGRFKEGGTGIVDLSDEHEYCVEALMYWLYSSKYCLPNDLKKTKAPKSITDFHLDMIRIADKRQATELYSLAQAQMGCSFTAGNITANASTFVKAIPMIWSLEGAEFDTTKLNILQQVCAAKGLLMGNRSFMSLIWGGGALACQLSMAMAKWPTRYQPLPNLEGTAAKQCERQLL